MLKLKKFSLLQRLMVLAACGNAALATGFVVNTAPATAQTATSSYPLSCREITIDNDLLRARCLRANLAERRTSIRVRGIANNNGQLVFVGTNQASSYQNSCREEEIYGATLVAECRRIDGSYQDTSILIPGIQNNDGRLSY